MHLEIGCQSLRTLCSSQQRALHSSTEHFADRDEDVHDHLLWLLTQTVQGLSSMQKLYF